jgi:hypothetical protein
VRARRGDVRFLTAHGLKREGKRVVYPNFA